MIVSKIQKTVVSEGALKGIPAVGMVLGSEGTEMTNNEIFEALLSLDPTQIVIRGVVADNPDLRDVIIGLASKGIKILLITKGHEVLNVLRNVPNIRFLIKLNNAKSLQNEVETYNLSLLKELDEIKIDVNTLEDYEQARAFLSVKTITRPTVVFSLNKKMDEKEYTKVMGRFISDKFVYNSKLDF